MHARVLRYFDQVVRSGSIRKAALELHVAPTAINRQILELEGQLGAALFDRVHKRLVLTPLGEMVLAHVRQTLKEHRELLGRVEEFKGARRGEAGIAVTAGLAGSLLPQLLHEFRLRHPGIVVRVADLPVAAIARAVEAGEVDLGLAWNLPEGGALRTLAGGAWPLGAVLPPGHALAGEAGVRLADCIGYPLIFPAPGMSIRGVLDAALAAAGIDAAPVVESTSTALIRRLVMLGAGIALLNPLDVVEERARGTLVFVPLIGAALEPQRLALVARSRGALSAAARRLADSLAAGIEKLPR